MTKEIDKWQERALKVIPEGCSTASKRPQALFGTDQAPTHFSKSAGVMIEDTRGHTAVDFSMALGPCVLGHNHPVVVDAIQKQLGRGIVSIFTSPLEVELAELLCDVFPSMEMVRFMKTGAEAASAAVRLARTYTGREHVLGCGYFGWHDWSQNCAGVPECVKGLYDSFEFNDTAGFIAKFNALPNPPAAVIMEPIVRQAPDPEFLAAIRKLCDTTGTVLIWDEIKTVCRVAPGGAQEYYGFSPDLTVVAKGLAGGMPLAAVGGKRDLMQTFQKTWISSTYAGETLSLAAGLAVVSFVRENKVCQHIETLGLRLMNGFEKLSQDYPDLFSWFGLPAMNALIIQEGHPQAEELNRKFFLGMYNRGYLVKRHAYNFVSFSHTQAQIDGCLQACNQMANAL